jgi:hypothetical protein
MQTPHYHRSPKHRGVYLDVLVTFPTPNTTPIEIKNFETDVPLYAHKVGDLKGSVLFKKLNLKGTNMNIDVEVRFSSLL